MCNYHLGQVTPKHPESRLLPILFTLPKSYHCLDLNPIDWFACYWILYKLINIFFVFGLFWSILLVRFRHIVACSYNYFLSLHSMSLYVHSIIYIFPIYYWSLLSVWRFYTFYSMNILVQFCRCTFIPIYEIARLLGAWVFKFNR